MLGLRGIARPGLAGRDDGTRREEQDAEAKPKAITGLVLVGMVQAGAAQREQYDDSHDDLTSTAPAR